MTEFGLFSDESEDYTSEQSVEAGFYSRSEAEAAIASRYSSEDNLSVHEIEEPEEEPGSHAYPYDLSITESCDDDE